MKIALIQAPCWGMFTPPLALASLSSYLRSKQHEVFVLDLNVELYHQVGREWKKYWGEAEIEFWKDYSLVEKMFAENNVIVESYLEKILEYDARIVGFSVYGSSLVPSLALAKKIKEKDKNKLIVFGGPQCSQYMSGRYIIEQDCVDIVVQGEGEEVLEEIVNLTERNEKVSFIPGTLLKRDGKIIDCGEHSLIKDLNLLPFPDFSDFSLDKYSRSTTLPISSSRGCIKRCVFCNEWPFWKKYRYRKGGIIFEEMKHQLQKFSQIKVFEFHDSLMNGNLEEMSKLCDLIIDNKLDISWAGQATIRGDMSLELLKKFKQTGCICLDYGLESGSDSVLSRIRKGCTVEEAECLIRNTHQAGIDVVVNFMFGFPGETEEDFQQTLEFVSRNKEYITSVNPSPSFCGIAQGTYLHSHPEEFGLILHPSGLFWKTKDGKNTYLERLKRFETFCQHVISLGIKSNYPYGSLVDREKLISEYYSIEGCDFESLRTENIAKIKSSFEERSLFVPGYPSHLRIELSSICNLFCTYSKTAFGTCPQWETKREQLVMSFELFKKIIDETGIYLTNAELYNYGESFISPRATDMIHYLKEKNPDVGILIHTNGHYFKTEEKRLAVINSGLDVLLFSVDGITQETYEKYRIGGNLSIVLEAIKGICSLKKKLGKEKPKIVFQFILFEHNLHEASKVEDFAKNLGVDEVVLKTDLFSIKPELKKSYTSLFPVVDRLQSGDSIESFSKKDESTGFCDFPWTYPTILADGRMVVCCRDGYFRSVMGSVKEKTLYEVWNGKGYQEFRRKYLEDEIKPEPCNLCPCSPKTKIKAKSREIFSTVLSQEKMFQSSLPATSKYIKLISREIIVEKYCMGKGIDIGCGEDPLGGINGIEKQDIRASGKVKLDYLCPCDVIPVEDERYDFVYASHVLEHLNNPIKALLEWRRILKVGGRIILIMPDCRLSIIDRKKFDIVESRERYLATLELLIENYRNDIPNAPEDWRNYQPWHYAYYYEHSYLWSLKLAIELLKYLEFKIVEGLESKPEFVELFDKTLLNRYFTRLMQKEEYEKFTYDITKLQEEHNFEQLDFSFIVVGEKTLLQPECVYLPIRKVPHKIAMRKFVEVIEPFKPIYLLNPKYLFRRLKTIRSISDLKTRIFNLFLLIWKILTGKYKYPLK